MNQVKDVVEQGDVVVLQFDCGCELRVFHRNHTGGLMYGFGSCTHDSHQRPITEILQFEDGLLLVKLYINRGVVDSSYRYRPDPRQLYKCVYCGDPVRLVDAGAVVDSYLNVIHLACCDRINVAREQRVNE